MGEAFKIVNCLNILNRLCDRRNARTGHNFFQLFQMEPRLRLLFILLVRKT